MAGIPVDGARTTEMLKMRLAQSSSIAGDGVVGDDWMRIGFAPD
ncbi:hypothetical protein GCM10023228_34410 [Brevibacillus fulvus]